MGAKVGDVGVYLTHFTPDVRVKVLETFEGSFFYAENLRVEVLREVLPWYRKGTQHFINRRGFLANHQPREPGKFAKPDQK